MNITIADQYYLKALDEYPWSITEVLENLNYALSYDDEHVGANHLMGKLYQEQFSDFSKAEWHFQKAMAIDSENSKLCLDYAYLMICTKEFVQADKLLAYTEKLKGLDMGEWYRLLGLLEEHQHHFNKALENYELASTESYNLEQSEVISANIDRVNEKLKREKRKLKKSKSSQQKFYSSWTSEDLIRYRN